MERILYLLLGLGLSGCASVRTDLSAPATWSELDGESVVVVRGDTVLPIVTESTARSCWAAMFLADIIEEMCGKRPDVMSVEKGQPCTVEKAMFVGEAGSQTEQAEATPDAFRIIAKNGCVRFLGRADFAVFDWCERELGLRYYCEEGR